MVVDVTPSLPAMSGSEPPVVNQPEDTIDQGFFQDDDANFDHRMNQILNPDADLAQARLAVALEQEEEDQLECEKLDHMFAVTLLTSTDQSLSVQKTRPRRS